MITGFHAESADPLIVTAAAVIEWWAPAAIAHDRARQFPDIGVSYQQPVAVEVHEHDAVRTAIRSGAGASFARRRVSLEDEIRIEMTADRPQPLNVFRRRVHACQDLISIAALTLCNLNDFRICPPTAGGRPGIDHVSGVPVFRNPAEAWPDFLFRSSDIEARLKETFAARFANAESLSVVRSLYMSGAYGKGFIELRFLTTLTEDQTCNNPYAPGWRPLRRPFPRRRPPGRGLRPERRMVKESLLTFDGQPLFAECRAYTVPYKLSDERTFNDHDLCVRRMWCAEVRTLCARQDDSSC